MFYHQPAGISNYTLNLLQAFADLQSVQSNHVQKDGLDISDLEFLVFQHRRHSAPLIDSPNFRRVTVYSPTHTKLEQLSLPLELLRFSLDLLHSTDFIPPLYALVPAVITVHDLAFLHWPHFLTEDSAAYYGQIDRAVTRARHIIVPSESTKQDLIAQLGVPDSRISVIYEAANPRYKPLPLELTRREITSKYKIPQKYILFVGTIEPKKNVDGLVKAFHYMRNKYRIDDVHLVIAGGYGWLYEETMRIVDELDLSKSTHLLGRVSDEDIWKLYVGAHCHVHAAHYEGFGLPPLEAMACGTPTIVSNVSSLPEVVGDAALLVDPNDWEEIAVAMHRLLTDQELHRELREKGLQRATCFSWRKAAIQTLSVYRHVLNPSIHKLSKPELFSPDIKDSSPTIDKLSTDKSSMQNSPEQMLRS
ncbi:glycosyltransferase family 4 protein [Chloroflexi bacterium TSY]|nr:glycosyltransferase family 4 protein [Chloroflexi bacterium TSY]